MGPIQSHLAAKTSNMARHYANLFLVALISVVGCAGSRVNVTAVRSHYPISLSPVLRDWSGASYDDSSLCKVGRFLVARTTVGFLYSRLGIPPTYDISDEVNTQVPAVSGEGVTNLTVTIGSGCAVLNGFPFLNVLPVWPGCVPLTISGEIIRRRNATASVAPRPK